MNLYHKTVLSPNIAGGVMERKWLRGSKAAAVGYVFGNEGKEAPTRFAALSALFDPGTKQHIEARGLRPGWRCLEVGGGGGTIAAWLASRVGPDGRVLATDIDPRFLQSLEIPNLEVRRHDIVEEPLPEDG